MNKPQTREMTKAEMTTNLWLIFGAIFWGLFSAIALLTSPESFAGWAFFIIANINLIGWRVWEGLKDWTLK